MKINNKSLHQSFVPKNLSKTKDLFYNFPAKRKKRAECFHLLTNSTNVVPTNDSRQLPQNYPTPAKTNNRPIYKPLLMNKKFSLL